MDEAPGDTWGDKYLYCQTKINEALELLFSAAAKKKAASLQAQAKKAKAGIGKKRSA
jgi:hypothetical protein